MAEPISRDEAKLNLRIDGNAEDSLVDGLIVAARDHVEGETGLVLTPRTITETAARFGKWIELAAWPVSSVDEIRYPVAGVMTVLATSAWAAGIKRRPVRIIPASSAWGSVPFGVTCDGNVGATLPIEIDLTAGFLTPDAVPASVKQAMHLLISHYYTNRAAVEAGVRAAAIEVPLGVEALLRRHRLEYV